MIDISIISAISVFVILNVIFTEFIKIFSPKRLNPFIPLILAIPEAVIYLAVSGGTLNLIEILKYIFTITAGSNTSYDLILKQIKRQEVKENDNTIQSE